MRTYAQQKAALTRAGKKGYEAVLLECRRAITDWESPEWAQAHRLSRPCWPDDWARWQRALDDAAPGIVGPQLDDLERIER